MVKEVDLIRAYDHFVLIGFAGVSTLQRRLKYPFWKAKKTCDKLIELGVIEAFDFNLIRDKRNMRLQKVLMKRDKAIKAIKNAF